MVPLVAFAVLNLVLAVVMMRVWARQFLGYRPEEVPLLRPTFATTIGGLRAAEQMRTPS